MNRIIFITIIILVIIIYQSIFRYEYKTLLYGKIDYIVRIDKLLGTKCFFSGHERLKEEIKLKDC